MCKKICLVLCLLCFLVELTLAQNNLDIDNDSALKNEKTAQSQNRSDLNKWTLKNKHFSLYVNVISSSDHATPQIDIRRNNVSWPFSMYFENDTLYLDIAPPGSAFNPSSINVTLKDTLVELPLVIKAGIERAIYWYSYNNGSVEIDTSLLPASFIDLMPVDTLAANIILFYLPNSGNNVSKIRKAMQELKNLGFAELIRLDDGYYQGIWDYVNKGEIAGVKLNWLGIKNNNIATLMVFELTKLENRQKADSILAKILNTT